MFYALKKIKKSICKNILKYVLRRYDRPTSEIFLYLVLKYLTLSRQYTALLCGGATASPGQGASKREREGMAGG